MKHIAHCFGRSEERARELTLKPEFPAARCLEENQIGKGKLSWRREDVLAWFPTLPVVGTVVDPKSRGRRVEPPHPVAGRRHVRNICGDKVAQRCYLGEAADEDLCRWVRGACSDPKVGGPDDRF